MSGALLPTYNRVDVAFERGEGAWLVATDGRRFLDFCSGIAVTALGHSHPKLVAALNEQGAKLWHTSNLFRVPGQEKLAERLCAATFADRVFFTNSGAESIELAIKMARRFHHVEGRPERYRLITFDGAFHGRTLATIAAGGNPKYLDGFGPAMPGFDQVAYGALAAAEAAIGPETAGFLVEPVQGEGGVRYFGPDFLRGLRALADRHGLLLVLDEVQSGMGRTGKLFAHEWTGVKPDIMATAKGIGGGFPLGACVATEAAAKGMVAGTHGSTYGGNPLAMAIGNAVLDVMLEDGFLEGVARRAAFFTQKLSMLIDKYPDVLEEIRGEGFLRGLKCRKPAGDLVNALREEGMLTVSAGDNTVRLLPPLIITEEELADATERLDKACARLQA